MKVLLINGSPHRKGNTNAALEEVASALESDGIKTDTFWIGAKPMAGCIACGKCKDKGLCRFDDKVNDFLKMADDYDGFVFGTPVYYASANGALISFLDRAFYADSCGGKNRFYLKPAAAISTARRAGTTATWDELNKYFGISNMPIVTSQYWDMAFAGKKPGKLKDDEGLRIMHRLGHNMAFVLKCKEAGLKSGIAVPKR